MEPLNHDFAGIADPNPISGLSASIVGNEVLFRQQIMVEFGPVLSRMTQIKILEIKVIK